MGRKWNDSIKIGDYVFASKYGSMEFDAPWMVGYVSRITTFYNNTTVFRLFDKHGKESWYEFRYARRISGKTGEKIIEKGMSVENSIIV